jgi:hypothetical protein
MVSLQIMCGMGKVTPYPVCLQKNQAGCVLFTVTENEGTLVALAVTAWKPESAPPDIG